jgi:phosphopantothenoylcysteine synthetase/decarboxylase
MPIALIVACIPGYNQWYAAVGLRMTDIMCSLKWLYDDRKAKRERKAKLVIPKNELRDNQILLEEFRREQEELKAQQMLIDQQERERLRSLRQSTATADLVDDDEEKDEEDNEEEDEDTQVVNDDDNDSAAGEFDCADCRKKFKSEKQYAYHTPLPLANHYQ